MARICVIDDQGVIRESVAQTLERADHHVTAFGEPTQALKSIRDTHYDLILTDLKMPKMDGLSVIRSVREAGCDTPIIVMTAFGTIRVAVEAMKSGAFEFIQKPFEAENLEIQVERALTHRKLQSENEALRTSLSDLRKDRRMVGECAAMSQIRKQIAQYAASDATVLICGESGTGKELAAAAIQESSLRRDRPMLCVNCAALSSNLLESELFGHERGAFTGADRQRRGRFELADSGTLLLDEISEMAMPLQAKLLRVLQEGEFERVGSSVTQRADVRVIATTNRDLGDWVSKKRFREDLFYRLNVLPLHLPPLRLRRDDIPLVAEHFLDRIARRAAAEVLTLTTSAIEAMRDYDWPGNIRELENVCQRAVATVSGPTITSADIGPWLSMERDDTDPLADLRPGRMLEDMERKLIERVLDQHSGHRAKSAKTLGMGIRTLGLKLKQWREQEETEMKRTSEAAIVL